MSALAAVEFANTAFYDAFSTADIGQMSELWADTDAIFCCHPGWQPIHGRDAVLRSWAEIFANAGPMPISHRVLARELIGEMAIVCGLESVSGHGFIATNLFVRHGKIWRMVHHHAGPIAGPVPIVAESPGPSPN
jgi:ketosteroid isomerase-like protein